MRDLSDITGARASRQSVVQDLSPTARFAVRLGLYCNPLRTRRLSKSFPLAVAARELQLTKLLSCNLHLCFLRSTYPVGLHHDTRFFHDTHSLPIIDRRQDREGEVNVRLVAYPPQPLHRVSPLEPTYQRFVEFYLSQRHQLFQLLERLDDKRCTHTLLE